MEARTDGASARRSWLAAGIAGLVGEGGAMCADVASGWSTTPDSAMHTALSLRLEDVAPLLSVKSPQALLLGHYLAILFIPFGILGIWHVSVLLRPAGTLWSRWFLLAGVLTLSAGTAYHGTYGFVATVLQVGSPSTVEAIAPFFEPFGTALIVAVVVTMLPLVVAILGGRTVYPRWVAVLTPLPVQLALSAIATVLPPAAANFLVVTGLNASMVVFLATSLAVTVPRVARMGPEQA